MHRRPADLLGGPVSPGQAMPRRTRAALAVALACLGLAAAPAAAQRTLALEPSVSVVQTFSDNYELGANPQSDAITRLTAAVGLRARAGALRGFLDYSLSSVLYARHSERNNLQNALNANLAADLIDNRLQLAATASISRSAISAFGVQPGSGSDANANTTEVRSLRITPTLRGPVGPAVRYTASLGYTITSAADSGLGDGTSTTATVRLEPTQAARLGWSVDASHLASDYKQGRGTQSDRLFGGLRLNLDELDLQLSATGGTERNNLTSLDPRSSSTWGLGLLWTPSPVTRLSADLENRFFGRSHAVSLEHRTPRTVFRYRNARSLSTGGDQQLGLQGAAYDLFYSLLASQQPDPALRDALVRDLLRREGIDPSRIISTGFLQSSATVQDLQELSAAWTGLRDTAVLSLSRSKSRRVDSLSTAVDDLSQTDSLTLTSLSLSLGHRLTPLSSLSLSLALQRGQGDGVAQSNRQTSAELLFNTRLTPESYANVSLRRAQYRTGLQPYDENALVVSYGLRF